MATGQAASSRPCSAPADKGATACGQRVNKATLYLGQGQFPIVSHTHPVPGPSQPLRSPLDCTPKNEEHVIHKSDTRNPWIAFSHTHEQPVGLQGAPLGAALVRRKAVTSPPSMDLTCYGNAERDVKYRTYFRRSGWQGGREETASRTLDLRLGRAGLG